MHTLPMPIRNNRLATLMVVAGIVGSGATLFKTYVLDEPVDVRATGSSPPVSKLEDICALGHKLAADASPAMRSTGKELLRANACPAP